MAVSLCKSGTCFWTDAADIFAIRSGRDDARQVYFGVNGPPIPLGENAKEFVLELLRFQKVGQPCRFDPICKARAGVLNADFGEFGLFHGLYGDRYQRSND